MAFHGFAIIEIPLHDKLSVSIHMHMPGRVISFPPNEDVPAAAEFAHPIFMLPCKVTVVNFSFPTPSVSTTSLSRIPILKVQTESHWIEMEIYGSLSTERQAIVLVTKHGKVIEVFRNPVNSGLA